MSKKLWVEHRTSEKTFIDKISIDGCEDVADFLNRLYEKPLLAIPPNTSITLYQPDESTEIDIGESPALLEKENARENPLIVRIVGIAENPPIMSTATPSKVASVLQSNMTNEEKESILKAIIAGEGKDRELQGKEREVQDKISLYEALNEKLQRIEAERDYLKGTLDARHIFEAYELRFPKRGGTRAERWTKHLKLNPLILKNLDECNQSDQKICWQDKAAEIYDELSRKIHQQTIDIGNGKYILMIEKSLSQISSCFVKVLAKELYGENVVVKEEVYSDREASGE
jgi:hypothetical protein